MHEESETELTILFTHPYHGLYHPMTMSAHPSSVCQLVLPPHQHNRFELYH